MVSISIARPKVQRGGESLARTLAGLNNPWLRRVSTLLALILVLALATSAWAQTSGYDVMQANSNQWLQR